MGGKSIREAVGKVVNTRRVATLATVAAGCSFGWHAVWGHNGISAYAGKRAEDRKLTAAVAKLGEENARLKQHVEHLESDPDAIEVTARQRLHYTRPGEVIYTLPEPTRAAK